MRERCSVILAVLLLAGATRCTRDEREHEDAGREQSAAFERGPHRGRWLAHDDFAVELTIFEQGVPPEFRALVYRDEKPIDPSTVKLEVTPEPKGENGGGLIGVAPATTKRVPVAVGEAVAISIARPAEVVYRLVVGLGRIVTGKEKASLTGPVGISKEIGKAAQEQRNPTEHHCFLDGCRGDRVARFCATHPRSQR